MLGKQSTDTELFQCVTMESLVPPNHTLRQLRAALDVGFVRERVAHLYSGVGRPSVDPEVVVRLWILQHFYGLSERQVCDETTMHAGFRWFCGLSFNDPVPDQSTLVKLRTEKWAGTAIWEDLLAETVRACEAAGIARPGARQRLGVDGTQIDANAAIASLEAVPPELAVICTGEATIIETDDEGEGRAGSGGTEIPAEEPPPQPWLQVEEGGNPRGSHRSGDPQWHGERFTNATHRSTTDPEARLYRKGGGQEAKLRYLGHYMADLRCGVIYDAMATLATGTAEREAALAMLARMDRPPDEAAFDLGYRDGEFLARVMDLGIQPLVPLQDEPLEEEPTWKRSTPDPERQEKRRRRVAAARARNATRLAARGRRGATAQRQRTRLEHLIGEAKEHHGLRRARGRGLVRLDQQIKLTASVQNLKRLLSPRRRRRAAAEVWLASPASISQTVLAQIADVARRHRHSSVSCSARGRTHAGTANRCPRRRIGRRPGIVSSR